MTFISLLVTGCGSDSTNNTGMASTNSDSNGDSSDSNLSTPINTGCDSAITQQKMLVAINEIRTKGYSCASGYKSPVKALSWNGKLAQASIFHARDMATNNYFSHTDLKGERHTKRFEKVGYFEDVNYLVRNSGENLAAGSNSIEGTMKQLLESETGHCDTIMSDNFDDFGMACAYNKDTQYRYYWAQSFGRKSR